MGKYLKQFFAGARSAMTIYSDLPYELPSRDGLTKDFESIRRDSNEVSRDMENAVEEYRDFHCYEQ